MKIEYGLISERYYGVSRAEIVTRLIVRPEESREDRRTILLDSGVGASKIDESCASWVAEP